MYQHSQNERNLLKQRATQFKGQIARFEGQTLDPEFFQQLRLRNGLYEERWSHMLRVAIPYGSLNSAQLRKLGDIAITYDKGFGHFTTRQNIQFNWPKLNDVPDILTELAAVDMHAIQTSGSCIRNISCDHFAGAAKDEIADPRPWCEIIRSWGSLHPEFNWLPRKFKFSVTGGRQDRAVIRMNDIGLQIVGEDAEETYFDIYVGGGMGRTPVIGKRIKQSLPGTSLLAYLQAMLRVYNQYGRRDHKYKSRIKILINSLGVAKYKALVEREVRANEASTPRFDKDRLKALKTRFNTLQTRASHPAVNTRLPVNDPAFQTWLKTNTFDHKKEGERIVSISLKGAHNAPGDLRADQMYAIAELADQFSLGDIRVSHTQNLILPHVEVKQIATVWQRLVQLKLASPNSGQLTDIIACPGYDFCSLANTTTLDIVRRINQRFDDLNDLHQLGPIRLNISGCMNSCGHHHVADIGILGVDKKGEQCYQITLGGRPGINASLGKRVGPAIDKIHIVDAIDQIIQTFVELRTPGESFASCFKRLGIQAFKERIYANH